MEPQPPASSSPPSPAINRVVQAWSEIPAFEDEEAEAAFWAETQIDARLMARDIHKAITPESAAIMLTRECSRSSGGWRAGVISTITP